ncbi:uncharacterized protein LOC100888989 [Strongylocentrotus purpuratus]|uniref:Uncharacterized protein n=1 Tax=Strongylocentrotus purpuratus TaxID=7668 RepID=A0A7M7NL20_STRPU|nr:uncharacterized protein LOC100888989 [Strongylocentrotus purpuratus]
MKKNKGRAPVHQGKIYMNLALSNQTKDVYGTRPYGGRKGITNLYPPSKAAFISERPTDFLNDVKNMVFRQTEEEERNGSPNWISKYNKELNHTGEQPLMVQRFLSTNKQEQQNGVLPAPAKPQSRFSVERVVDKEFQQGLSLHQYLTATEMPGQSEKLVDVRHGRPTRTSLLRARQRIKNIPVPERAKLDLRDDIHYLQEQALKREDKYKTVDVPEDLQPLTEGAETVHQFLVGARYNRAHYRDAKCFNKVGLYVSRENPQHCFLNNGTTRESLLANKPEKANNIALGAFSEVTASELNSLCQSTSSFHKLLQPPSEARQAWGTSSIASAPSPTPNDSRESFATSLRDESEFAPKSKVTERSQILHSKRVQLKSASGQQSSSSLARSTVSSCDSCILCQEGSAVKHGVPVHFHGRNIMSAPSRRKWTHHAQRGRNTSNDNPSYPGKRQGADLMLVQQYHLRILGTQSRMSMKEERINSPDIKLHYTPRQALGGVPRPQTAASSSRQNPSRNRNSNNEMDGLSEEGIAKRNGSDAVSTVASTASKISVHISTGEEDVVEEGSPRVGAVDPEATPRSQDVTVGSTRGGGESLADVPTPRTQDLIDLTPREEAQDCHTDREGNTGQHEPNVSIENGTSNGQFEDMLGKVETVQGASDIPSSGMIQEDGEYDPECQVTDEEVVDLHGQMAQVNLNDTTDGVAEDNMPGENVDGDVTEQIDDGTDVIAVEKLHCQESGVVPQEEEPGELNNNKDQVHTVSFAEPDR